MTPQTPAQPPADARPLLAVVTGHLPPYRVHFHRRIAAEAPGLRLATLVTKYRSGPWVNPEVPEIGCVMFEPEDLRPGSGLAKLRHERGKGRAVREWLMALRPSAVVLIGYDEIPNLYALGWARRARVPALLWADSNDRGDRTTGIKRLIKNVVVPAVCRRVQRVLVCGSAGEAYFRRYGVPSDRMNRVPYEPDYGLILSMGPETASLLARQAGADPSDGRRRIVCCCRLVREKRVELVIEAFRGVVHERPDWDLLIAGDGPLRAALEERAGDLRRSERIRFLGFQDQQHVTALYRCSHALVLASDYEPWALVINEAAAAGLAIVATDCVGAARELVHDGVNGRVVPSGDLEALTGALRDVTHPGAAEALGLHSRNLLARWRREADPVAGLLEALRAVGVNRV